MIKEVYLIENDIIAGAHASTYKMPTDKTKKEPQTVFIFQQLKQSRIHAFKKTEHISFKKQSISSAA